MRRLAVFAAALACTTEWSIAAAPSACCPGSCPSGDIDGATVPSPYCIAAQWRFEKRSGDTGRSAGPICIGKLGSGGHAVMQLGMIGLGRMGGNIVRRLMRDGGHHCIVYDRDSAAVRALADEG